MEGKTIYCNKCGKNTKIKPRKQKRGPSIEINYFRCSNCKEKYIFSVLDQDCRKLQREIRRLQKSKNIPANDLSDGKITENEYVKLIDDINEEIKTVQLKLKEKMDKLIMTYK